MGCGTMHMGAELTQVKIPFSSQKNGPSQFTGPISITQWDLRYL